MNVRSFKEKVIHKPHDPPDDRHYLYPLLSHTNMRTIVKIGWTAMIMTGIMSCSDNTDKEDVTNTVNRAGSVETAVTVQHADSTHDVLVTTHKVWVNFQEYKTVVHQDTIPALGMENTTAENADGDKKDVSVKKDYEIYITVK